jgi:hypothetical protein
MPKHTDEKLDTKKVAWIKLYRFGILKIIDTILLLLGNFSAIGIINNREKNDE